MQREITTYQSLFGGLDEQVPLLDGTKAAYTNLDNAASTPALLHVQNTVNDFLKFYSSVHRGTGFKSQLATHAYEDARQEILSFVSADPAEHVCIFGKNTTEAINKLAHRFPFTPNRNIVLVSTMEHHSNDLPWRFSDGLVIHIQAQPDGRLDEEDFDRKLNLYRDHLALVAISGASNVTGYLNPIHRLAEKTHQAGAEILVDCAQLAPHRQIVMGGLDQPDHLDYVALSAHKMYAPFGSGALVGKRSTFAQGDPDTQGGGQVEIVTLDQVEWSAPPERDESGSPNTVGAVAMAAAAAQLQSIGMAEVAIHEAGLTAYALEKLNRMERVIIYGDKDPQQAGERLGVIPINVEGMSHFLVAAILGHEFGIGVRNGCFCAHPYLLHLMGIDPNKASYVRQAILENDRREVPGMVRISFGLYNTLEDIDRLLDALQAILAGKYRGNYLQDKASGEYHPEGWQIDFEQYFSFKVR
jgi:cysteine desulfurase/selenocysteine lyase